MPGIFYEPISRKRFCRIAAGSLAGCWAWNGMARGAAPDKWRVALLSDTHIPQNGEEQYRGFAPVENLRKVVTQIEAARPEAAVVCGDAARLTGEVGDYKMLRGLLAPIAATAPILIGLGNHDDRRKFSQVFPAAETPGKQNVSGKHVTVLEHPTTRIVVLDSLLYVNKVAGLLGKAQRVWLEQQLPKLSDRPLVMFVHHTLGDGDGDLLDVDRLMSIIEPQKHVKAIFYGHSHQFRIGERSGVRLVNLPACGYNFNDNEPVGWVDATFSGTGVALRLNAIGGNRKRDQEVFDVKWR